MQDRGMAYLCFSPTRTSGKACHVNCTRDSGRLLGRSESRHASRGRTSHESHVTYHASRARVVCSEQIDALNVGLADEAWSAHCLQSTCSYSPLLLPSCTSSPFFVRYHNLECRWNPQVVCAICCKMLWTRCVLSLSHPAPRALRPTLIAS